VITWDEEFSHRYDEWSASMTADVDFYIDVARITNRPIVELGVKIGGSG
jgi:hypothetical protein